MRAFRSYGAVDPYAKQVLTNAKNAGLVTDIYMFPCRSKSASTQVTEMIDAIPSNHYGKIWLDIETNTSPNCGWGKDYSSNCKYV